MHKMTKATSIPKSVKEAVYERDGGRCILCGRNNGEPVAHVIRRSQGGKGIEQNIVTLCPPATAPLTRDRRGRRYTPASSATSKRNIPAGHGRT